MTRKRKHADAWSQNDFVVPASQVNTQTSARNALVVTQHVDKGKVVQQSAVLPAPSPVGPTQAHRDFYDINDLLADADEVQVLQDSEEVIHHYIQGPGHQRKKKKTVPGQYATTVTSTHSSCQTITDSF